MSCPTCRYFNHCNSPLCPEDAESLARCAWFPDEESCHRRDLRGARWIVRQRRIAKVTGGDSSRGCFTFAMLSQNCRVMKGVRGLDPESGEISAERVGRWLKEHRSVREWTAEERAVQRSKVAKTGALKSGGSARESPASRAPVTHPSETVSEAATE